MKNLKYTITSILLLTLSNNQTHTEFITFTDFESFKKKSLYRIILLPSLITAVGYMHKDTLKETIIDYPVTSCLASYIVGTYLIDSYYEYKKINSILDILQASEKINSYLLCAIMLKKDQRFSKNSSNPVIGQMIAEKIHEYTGFQIHEIEEITAQCNKKALEYLNKFEVIHFDFQLSDLERIISKQNCTIYEIIPLFEKDPELYQELLNLEKDQNLAIDAILHKIGLKIKHEIQLLLNTML